MLQIHSYRPKQVQDTQLSGKKKASYKPMYEHDYKLKVL